MGDQGLRALFGYAKGRRVVVRTSRGVEIPLHRAHRDWTLEELARMLADVDALPETEQR